MEGQPPSGMMSLEDIRLLVMRQQQRQPQPQPPIQSMQSIPAQSQAMNANAWGQRHHDAALMAPVDAQGPTSRPIVQGSVPISSLLYHAGQQPQHQQHLVQTQGMAVPRPRGVMAGQVQPPTVASLVSPQSRMAGVAQPQLPLPGNATSPALQQQQMRLQQLALQEQQQRQQQQRPAHHQSHPSSGYPLMTAAPQQANAPVAVPIAVPRSKAAAASASCPPGADKVAFLMQQLAAREAGAMPTRMIPTPTTTQTAVAAAPPPPLPRHAQATGMVPPQSQAYPPQNTPPTTAPTAAPAGQMLPLHELLKLQQRQQQEHQQREQQAMHQAGRGRGRGRGRGKGHMSSQGFSSADRDGAEMERRGRDLPAQDPPKTPDPVTLERFKTLYAAQNDHQSLDPSLQAQHATTMGTIGSLDLDRCIELIESHDISFITTDTGTGKSTLIPKALLERHRDRIIPRSQLLNHSRMGDVSTDNNNNNNTAEEGSASASYKNPSPHGLLIVSAQPRRTSAINLAHRVAHLLDSQDDSGDVDSHAQGSDTNARADNTTAATNVSSRLGNVVGYAVRGEQTGEIGETPLMYVTNYTLFLHLLSHRPQDIPFTYVILDEFHERTPEVEVIMLLLKLAMIRFPGRMKLILSSATADADLWTSFFDGVGTVGVFNQAAAMYPVHDFYADDISKLLGTNFTQPEIRKDEIVSSLQLQQLMLTLRQLLTFLAAEAMPQHSILIFLPGRTLVEGMREWILKNMGDQLDPVVWYRDVDLAVIQAALKRETFTKKKVYLATNIAEVGLTLPDVVFVIDLATVKRPQVLAKKPETIAFPPLQLLWEDAASAQQRRGRVGRVQRGFYFSLVSTDHHAALKPSASRIENAVLHELVLHVLQLTSAPAATFSLCREQPRDVSVSHSLLTLQDAGMIMDVSHPLAAMERMRIADDADKQDHIVTEEWTQLVKEQLEKNPPLPPPQRGTRTRTSTSGDAAAIAAASPQEETNATMSDANGNTQTSQTNPSSSATATKSAGARPLATNLREYQITVKGCIVGRSPVGIEAGTTVFLGIQFGVATLSIIASAIEATKTPFFVPYDIPDRAMRSASCGQVSREMAKYHGELKSDIISCLGAVLDYLDMQRDGLSEEAQEAWCASRHLSRARLVDTVNLVTQMKTQLRPIIPFVDVSDIDALKSQFEKQADTLMLLNVASHMQWAVYVSQSPEHAMRKRFCGEGIFTRMRCCQNATVPTVCPWERFSVCVPLSLQTTYGRLLATFATQLEAELFNVVLLLFSPSVLYVPPTEAASTDAAAATAEKDTTFLFFVRYMDVTQSFQCDALTAQQIIQLRRIQCAEMSIMQLQVEERVKPEDTAAMTAHLASLNTDFGIPEQLLNRPDLIPTLLHTGLKQLIQRVHEKQVWCQQQEQRHRQEQMQQRRRGGGGGENCAPPLSTMPPGLATCVTCNAPLPTREVASQSILMRSGNGIRPLASLPIEEAESILSAIAPNQRDGRRRGGGDGGNGKEKNAARAAHVEDDVDDEVDAAEMSSSASSEDSNAARFEFDG